MRSDPDLGFEVREYEASRAREVATLHRIALPRAFLTSLGTRFLIRLYDAIHGAPDAIVLVAVSRDGRTLGFVSGAMDLRRTYRHVLLHAGPALLAAIVSRLGEAALWRSALETIGYPLRHLRVRVPASRGTVSEVRSELLSLAVDAEARGRGIGRTLVSELESWLVRVGAGDRYRVATEAADPRSNAFYASVGFVLVHAFEHHGRPMNLYEKRLT